MTPSIFEYKDYKIYLRHLAKTGIQRRGFKSAMAKAMHCQSTYVSQVLNANAHLSLEQAEALSPLLNHSDEEMHFFLLMVQKERAGTQSLRKLFSRQMQEIVSRRLLVAKRLNTTTTLSAEDQAVYYSSWLYAAIHLSITIPELDSKEKISQFLQVPIRRTNEIFEFLLQRGLVLHENGKYKFGPARVFLGKDSPNIVKHHANWRNQSIESLDRETERDLHYSSVFTLSKEDVLKIKDLLLEAIKNNLQIIQSS
ncbi:MAG: TIGR02147 family protein, partial [Pseudobdellovibrionaceae bacterium]